MNRQLIALLAATALVPVAALAQTGGSSSDQPRQTVEPRRTTDQEQELGASEFINRAALSNMLEIRSSELAQTRSDNDEVQRFALRMIRDHKQATERLKAAAQNEKVPTSLDPQHSQALNQLQDLSGSDFDWRYVRMQLIGHREAIGLFEKYAKKGKDKQLQQYAEQTVPTLQEHLRLARQLRRSLNTERLAEANQTDDGRQPGGAASSDNREGRIVVQQHQPRITVHQQPPEIIVRQAAPTITVQQPQPEIIVRMPEPDVDVAMPRPKVDINRPQVAVQPPRQQAQVEVQPQDRKPNVRVEKVGQPRLVYQQAPGKPQIRYEGVSSGGHAQPQAQTGSTAPERGATDEERRRARARLGVGQPNAQPGEGQDAATQRLPVDAVEDLAVYNMRGEKLGDVEEVVADAQNRRRIVIGHGGFLGIGEDEVAFPVERFGYRGDRLVIRGVTDDDIEQMAEYRDTPTDYRELAENDSVELRDLR